jgi:Flp pilus assembly pilin Flp
MMTTLKRLWNDDEAANAVEYGLITAVIAITLIAILWTFRNALFGRFSNSATEINNSSNPRN